IPSFQGYSRTSTDSLWTMPVTQLLALLNIAFCWGYKTVEWRNEQKEIKVKKHGRKAISYFRRNSGRTH
ncbi:MAG: hypothetical protein JJT82_03250, partial [Legionellaceae bacterium]|nr:hypothetical protein [Legionellaceae bacterium]